MITQNEAKDFALDWIHSWNSHNLKKILEHYSSNIEFHSPFIPLLNFNETGIITSKSKLEKYFKIGLDSYPDLNFKLHNVFTGIDSITIYYSSVNNRKAAEVFFLNEERKASKVYCNYSTLESLY